MFHDAYETMDEYHLRADRISVRMVDGKDFKRLSHVDRYSASIFEVPNRLPQSNDVLGDDAAENSRKIPVFEMHRGFYQNRHRTTTTPVSPSRHVQLL